MTRGRAIYTLGLLFVAGCGQLPPDSAPVIVGQRTTTVSDDDPYIDMQGGTRIGVDGVPAGQSVQLKVTQYRAANGSMAVDVDTDSEPIADREQP